MKQFACGDVVPGCDATFSRATDEEIFAEVAAHAQSAHGMTEIPDEVVEQVKAHISVVE